MKQHKNTRLLTTPVLQSPELEMKGFLQTGMHFFFPKFYLKHARWDYELKKNKTKHQKNKLQLYMLITESCLTKHQAAHWGLTVNSCQLMKSRAERLSVPGWPYGSVCHVEDKVRTLPSQIPLLMLNHIQSSPSHAPQEGNALKEMDSAWFQTVALTWSH